MEFIKVLIFVFVQVHDIMDEIAEQQDVAKEIAEAISNPVAFDQVRYLQSIPRDRLSQAKRVKSISINF